MYPLFSTEVIGSTIRDVDGFEYIDLSAGSGSQPLGGSNPELVSLIAEKSKQFGHISFPYLNESTIELSEKLAARLGEYLLRRCNELMEKHDLIGDVRGKGLFAGIELVKDRYSKLQLRRKLRSWLTGLSRKD